MIKVVGRALQFTLAFAFTVIAALGCHVGVSAAQLTLTWVDSSSDEIGFSIERGIGADNAYEAIGTTSAGVTQYVDTTTASGTTYCYRVRAYNFTGYSDYSNSACGTTAQAANLAVVNTGATSASGTVVSNPSGITCGVACSASYGSGSVVVLSATSGPGSVFTGWSGAGCSGTGTCTVTLTGSTVVSARFDASGAAAPVNALAASILPSGRSAQVGIPVTAFATVLNGGVTTANAVGIVLATAVPVNFKFNATSCLTNAVAGGDNVPVDIPPGGQACYVIALTPTAPFNSTNVAFAFAGTNTLPVPPLVGLNTLLLSAANGPVPDIVALAATLSGDGIADMSLATGTGLFAVATVNVGAAGTITATVDTGSANLPISMALCRTDPATGQCISNIGSNVVTQIGAGATPTFGIFLSERAVVPFDPVNNRVFVRFIDSGGVTRGSTSVAVRTQ
jgi:hypothetical protein